MNSRISATHRLFFHVLAADDHIANGKYQTVIDGRDLAIAGKIKDPIALLKQVIKDTFVRAI